MINKTKRQLIIGLNTVLSIARGSMWSRTTPLEEDKLGLDLGCGRRKRIGFIGLDAYPDTGVDVVCNIEHQQLPFKDNTFDIVAASHLLEHIKDLDSVLAEISRILKPGGKLQITVPYAGDLRAFQDPTHVRFFTIKTCEYYVANGSRVGGWYVKKHFKHIARRSLVFGFGPLSILMGLMVNRTLGLLDLYESSPLRIVIARDIQIELEK